MNIDQTIKAKLLARCFLYVEQRMETSKEAMKYAQDSANMEEKNSAGDKYETGRAMAQIERDKAARQLDEALKLRTILYQINPVSNSSKITSGTLVITEASRFYLAISIGNIIIEGLDYIVLAPTSPIGKTLLNLKKGDQFTFNKRVHSIIEVL
ncbi:MAG: 3-oxoacyl-ACP synthase [Bacteroidia bacterium]|nr:3-oxoacyl-ACP synthase [Bacteroidia bacterium]